MARELTPDAVMTAVERHMGGPFVWGATDCTRSACAVFADLHGIDLAGDAPAYAGPVSAARIVRRAGGMVAMGEALAARHGLRQAVEPGAIGVVEIGGRQVAAICVQPGAWAAKGKSGFAMMREAVAAWSI